MLRHWRCAFALALGFAALTADADTVTVAVASNFSMPLNHLATDFERETGHDVRVVAGSTGRLYAQIVNGAPFDVFLAADEERPRQLEADKRIVAGSRFTYAEGILVIFSADQRHAPLGCRAAIATAGPKEVAIANPELAPYGRAAREFLQSLGQWQRLEPSLVRGENVAQVAQFVASRNANLGFIAMSQLEALPLGEPGCVYEVPADAHAPIVQQAVQLSRSADSAAANAFVAYLKSAPTAARLEALGYRMPR